MIIIMQLESLRRALRRNRAARAYLHDALSMLAWSLADGRSAVCAGETAP